LAKIARRYNEANPSTKIPISRSRDELWYALKSRIPECSDERCWLGAKWLPFGDLRDVEEDFKPPIPYGKHVWLDTADINTVLYQYEKVFPKFRYLGAQPIDFASVMPDIIANLKRYLRSPKKVETIGLVLNLDRHDEPGSHWTAVFIDARHPSSVSFEYFDSLGERAPDEVRDLVDDLLKRVKYQYHENKIEHQLKNAECGNYAINFIVQRLAGASFNRVTQNIIRDKEMNKKRAEFFDPHHSNKRS
jgi:hypothetical protein